MNVICCTNKSMCIHITLLIVQVRLIGYVVEGIDGTHTHIILVDFR